MQQEVKGVETGKYRIRFVPAGEIRLRVIEDTNGNGVFSVADIVLLTQYLLGKDVTLKSYTS